MSKPRLSETMIAALNYYTNPQAPGWHAPERQSTYDALVRRGLLQDVSQPGDTLHKWEATAEGYAAVGKVKPVPASAQGLKAELEAELVKATGSETLSKTMVDQIADGSLKFSDVTGPGLRPWSPEVKRMAKELRVKTSGIAVLKGALGLVEESLDKAKERSEIERLTGERDGIKAQLLDLGWS